MSTFFSLKPKSEHAFDKKKTEPSCHENTYQNSFLTKTNIRTRCSRKRKPRSEYTSRAELFQEDLPVFLKLPLLRKHSQGFLSESSSASFPDLCLP